MKKILVVLVPAALIAGILTQIGQSQQEFKVREFMRRKLSHAQNVLEGIAVEDCEQIALNAETLSMLSQAAEWQIFPSAEYKQYSAEFRRTADALVKMAEAKNLDGAALKYVELTMNCVNCHKYVRSMHVDERKRPVGSNGSKGAQTMDFQIPRSLKREHDELHAELVKATRESGRTGEEARTVANLLHPHFVKEEEYALPPLGLLAPWAEGKVTPNMEEVLKMTDRLKADLPEMVREHHEIVRALRLLADAAAREDKPQYAHFAEKLMLHAQTEEEVLYPAAILIGEYAKLKLNK